MMRRSVRLAAALVVTAAPIAQLPAQRATALAAGVTRPIAPRVGHGLSAATATAASSQDTKVVKGAMIGAGIGAAIGLLVVVAGKSTGSGPDHSADSDSRVIFIPGAAVLGGLLGIIVASRL